MLNRSVNTLSRCENGTPTQLSLGSFAVLSYQAADEATDIIRVSVSVETYLEEKVDNYCIIIIAITTCGHSECNWCNYIPSYHS